MRGNFWTNALFGIKAKEIHLCGEERALGLITKLPEKTQEPLIVHEYDRLSSLKVEKEPFTSLENLR